MKPLILTNDKGLRWIPKSQYMADLLDALHQKPLSPRVYDVEVRHDDWCSLLAESGPCNCNPDIKIKELASLGGQSSKAVR